MANPSTQTEHAPESPTKPHSRPSLLSNSFTSRCPPLVTPDTTIIAVCGPNDFEGNAHPDRDGSWYIWDFYLFHHLLRGCAAPKQQYWMTCVDPRDLVRKYGKAVVQGDSRSCPNDRRVVLGEEMVAEGEVKDIMLFSPETLLNKFLDYVADSCKAAKDTESQQPILILMFGHGRGDTLSISGGADNYELCPQLVEGQLREAIYRHNSSPNISFLRPSCFGGGWIQTPFSDLSSMPLSVVEKSDSETEKMLAIRSWPETECLDRLCGSRYTYAVTKALLWSEIENLDGERFEDIRFTPTFEALVEKIRDVLTREVDIIQEDNNGVSFSVKDDVWDPELRAHLSGSSLSTYRERWESLRLVPRTGEEIFGATCGSQDLSRSMRFSDSIRLTVPEAEFRLKRLAYDYYTSNPGDDSAAKNHGVASAISEVMEGQAPSMPVYELEDLAGSLNYRLRKITARATEFKNLLSIPFVDCCHADVNKLRIQLEKNHDYQLRARYSVMYSLVLKFPLFDEPSDHEGMYFVKALPYLAVLLCHSGWSREKAEDGLAQLVRHKKDTSPIEVTMKALKFREMPDIRKRIEVLSRAVEEGTLS